MNRLFIALVLMMQIPAYSQNHTGGGTGVITLPDGKTVLVDPFVVEQGRVIRLNPILKRYLDEAKSIIQSYTDCSSVAKFLQTELFDETNNILLTKDLPDDPSCILEDAIPNRLFQNLHPSGVACTIQGIIYIKDETFRKLTVEEQVGVLVHEKLHVALYSVKKIGSDTRRIVGDEARTHMNIFAVGSGVTVALRKLQAQSRGDRTAITEQEQLLLQAMYDGLRDLDESCRRNPMVVWPNGGGLIPACASNGGVNPSCRIAPTAFIGVASTLEAHGSFSIAENVALVNSRLIAPRTLIQTNSKIENSKLISEHSIQLGQETTIKNSFLHTYRNLQVGNGARIIDSLLNNNPGNLWGDYKSVDMKIGKDSTLESTRLVFKGLFVNRELFPSFSFYTSSSLIIDDGSMIKWLHVMVPVDSKSNRPAEVEAYRSQSRSTIYALQISGAIDQTSSPFTGCPNQSHVKLAEPWTKITSAAEIEAALCNK